MRMVFTPLDHESFFHAVMATIPSSIFILDERLSVLTVSHNFVEKSRCSLSAILGRRLDDIFPMAFQSTALQRQIRDVISTGNTLRHQRMTYRAPGVSFRVYSYTISQLQLLTGARGAILVMEDVTDLLQLGEEVRRTQLHLSSVVECAGDLIVSTDPNGNIMTWNAAAEKATGYTQLDTHGLKLADQIDEPQNLEVANLFGEITKIDDRRSAEWRTKRRSGESIPVSWTLSKMLDDSGGVTGVVVVGRNLVEQRAMEEQIRQGEKLAALGMVIGGIAHEIRNPLGVCSAAAQLLQDKVGASSELEEYIGKITAGVERASLVVESLLRFARPGPIAETAKVDILEVLKNALMFASGEAAAGTVVERKWPSSGTALYAEGVQNLLELVIINLVLNAFQAMPGGGRLTIDAYRKGSEIVIEISDTGPGIPECHLSKIFDPFFTTRSDSRRSGLGLSVSHSIVQQHGGDVRVRTSREGTIFVVSLPIAKESAESVRS